MRKEYILTTVELIQFKWLRPFPGEALAFWEKVATARQLDCKTVISNGEKFTALPLNHGKHWCFPIAIKCKKKPVYIDS